jgi:hypothetical protein
MGGHPRRVQWNVNGYKALSGADSADNLRLIQTVIEEPKYEVLVRLRDLQAAQEAAAALRQPAFPLYLGTAFCRAFVRDVEVKHDLSELDTDEIPWAYWAQELTIGEAVPFSRHVVNDDEAAERIVSRGFWVYPTPAHPPPQDAISEDPCVTGYMRL